MCWPGSKRAGISGQSTCWPEIYLFGSFARGALEPHDVDIAVEFARDERWASHLVNSLRRGRDPHAVFRRALTGGRRGLQFLFDPRASGADFEMMPLWRRDESIQLARERLHAIVPDPRAGRAPRDAMIPQFEGLESWIPRPYREHLVDAVDSHAVALERFTLADGVVGRQPGRRLAPGPPVETRKSLVAVGSRCPRLCGDAGDRSRKGAPARSRCA